MAALGGLLFGFDTAIINGAIVFLKRQFQWSDLQTEVAASSLLVGCILGSSIAGWLSDRLGRKRVLLLSAAIFALSSVVTAIANSLSQFSIARLVAGSAIGIASMLVPLYIAEISPENIRGRLVSLNQLAIMLGILFSYLTGWALSFAGNESWRWMFASVAIPSLFFFFALFAVPESPRWLVKSGATNQAIRLLAKLGQPVSRVNEIEHVLKEEADANLFHPSLGKPLLIGIVLAVLQQITGINTILYYGSVIFTEHAGARSASAALWANVIIGAVNLIFTIIAVLTIDKIGRKPLLMIASAGMGTSLAILAYLFSNPQMAGSKILIFIVCYVAFFSVGIGPGVWVVISELFPTKVRGQAMSVATISLWSACLLITSTFLSLVKAVSIRGAFSLYAVLCLCTLVFVWRVIPETKGQTLESIERQWMSSE